MAINELSLTGENMIQKQFHPVLVLLALVALCLSKNAWSGNDQTTFKGVSGYAAGKGCTGGNEGQDESASGVKPSLHTVEKPGDGWAMAAVSVDYYVNKKLKGCEGVVNGVKVKVMDTCPACARSGKIDINHSECSRMDSSNAGPTTVSWTNCKVDKKEQNPGVPNRNGKNQPKKQKGARNGQK